MCCFVPCELIFADFVAASIEKTLRFIKVLRVVSGTSHLNPLLRLLSVEVLCRIEMDAVLSLEEQKRINAHLLLKASLLVTLQHSTAIVLYYIQMLMTADS